jgi:hypothetical protein
MSVPSFLPSCVIFNVVSFLDHFQVQEYFLKRFLRVLSRLLFEHSHNPVKFLLRNPFVLWFNFHTSVRKAKADLQNGA